MMKALLTAGLLLCLATASAIANQANCRADLDALRIALDDLFAPISPDPLSALEPIEEDGRCILRDLSVRTDRFTMPFTSMWEAREIAWRSIWANESRSGIPLGLALDIRNARDVEHTDDLMGVAAYLLRLTTELDSVDLHLDYAIDPVEKRLVLTSLDVARSGGDRLALSGTVENFDLAALTAQPPHLDKIMQFRFMDLDLKLRNVSLFESRPMIWLLPIYPDFGDTPESAVDNTKAWLIEQIGGMPDYLVTQDSREAMVAMVNTLPHPRGVMHLTLSAKDGIAWEDVMPALLLEQPTWEMLERPLTGVRLKADWQPPKDCNYGDW